MSKNDRSSIFNQVKSALETVVMSEAEQKAYKAEHQVDSIKKALRDKGKPNRRLPAILGKRTFSGYLETCTTFFERARDLGIKISGIHRLRSNYAQEKYRKLREKGKQDRQARQEVSHSLGHNRIDVTKGYIPI